MLVKDLLDQLKREFIKVNVLQASLDALVVFLSTNLVLYVSGFQLVGGYSNLQSVGVLSLVFAAGDLFYRVRTYRLEVYEEKNPQLHEILRTARDNLSKEHTAAEALFNDLFQRVKTVTSDSIIPSRSIIKKIVIVGVLSFVTMMSGLVDVQLQDNGGQILPDFSELFRQQGNLSEEGFEMRNGSEVFGDRADMRAADMDLSFNVTGQGRTVESRFEAYDREAREAFLETTGDSLTGDLELAKQYSLAIKRIDG